MRLSVLIVLLDQFFLFFVLRSDCMVFQGFAVSLCDLCISLIDQGITLVHL